jgi:hypothetical protein
MSRTGWFWNNDVSGAEISHLQKSIMMEKDILARKY